MVVTQFVKVYLVADKRKTASKRHNEVLHVVDDIAFYDSLIHFFVMHTQFFHIDVVKQILILEHLNSTIGLFVVWQRSEEIIRHIALMMIEVLLFNDTRQLVCGGFVVVTIAYIEQTFVRIFRVLQYTYMMCKTNAKKFH